MSQLPAKAPQSADLKILPVIEVALLADLTPFGPASAHPEPHPACALHSHTFQLTPIAPCQNLTAPTPSLPYLSPEHLIVSQVDATMTLSVFLFLDFPLLLFLTSLTLPASAGRRLGNFFRKCCCVPFLPESSVLWSPASEFPKLSRLVVLTQARVQLA